MILPRKENKEQAIRSSAAEYLTYVASVGDQQDSLEMRYEDENIWLTQKMMATLYGVSVSTVNEHIKKVFLDSELEEDSVIRKFRITAADGKSYNTNHYNLQMIIAVGFKVNNERAVQFRKWANQIVKDYTIKGWVMDDERLKNGGFPMTLKFIKGTFQVVLKQNLSYTAELGEDVLGNITRINHALEKIPENLEAQKRFLTTLEGELVNAKEEAARDFPQEQELAEKSARLAELNAELDKAERSKKKPAREESEQETPTAEKPSIRQQLKDYEAPMRADAGTERAPWRGPVR